MLTLFLILSSCCRTNLKPHPHYTKPRQGKSEKNLYFQGFSEPGAPSQNCFEAAGVPFPEQSSKQAVAGLGVLSCSGEQSPLQDTSSEGSHQQGLHKSCEWGGKRGREGRGAGLTAAGAG